MQSPPGLHRVKLYKLNETGGWDDKGTGLVSVGPMEFANHQSNSVGLVVIGEETQKMLMVHRILHEDIYNRQDETIITWTDPDIGTDVALSFQEGQGCSAIWQHILRVQSDADPKHPDHRRRVIDEFDGAHHLDGDYPHHDVGGEMGGAGGHVELPAAEMGNLEEISKVLAHVPPMQRERVAQLLLAPGYVRKLLDLFRQSEDLEDLPSMQHMFRLMRSIIMLNDTQLLDELLKEEHVMDVMGCLEYDPDLTAPQQHRSFLQTAVVFKEVVPITSQEVLAKIHQTYRIQYLKDVILPRSLDDATYATLSSLMLFNNVDVVLGLYQDAAFLPQLFAALKSRQPGDPDWDDLVAFLQEFCSLSKHLQLQQRQNLWNKMTQLGLFDVITRILQSSSAPVKLRATDILLSALAHDPLPLRSFLAAQEGHQLLDGLVAEFIGSEQSGLPEQIAELLKLLVDPETMEGAIDKNDFMEVFYTKFLEKLIAPVCSDTPAAAAAADAGSSGSAAAAGAGAGAASKGGGVPASTIGLIVDLLCFCVQHHQYWAKYHVLRKNVVEKVLCLLRRKERWLVVAGVRFLRTCVGTKDDFYMRHLTSKALLDPVMGAFFDNGPRYNLLNSAVLELVEFIRKENIKVLIEHLVSRFGHRFDEVGYVDTFKQLQLKWEQAREVAAAGSDAPAGPGLGGRLYSSKRRLRRDDRDLDKDEEDYFSEDAVEEPGPAAAAAGAAAAAAYGGAAGSGGEPRLIIKGLYKPAAGSAGAAAGSAAGRGAQAAAAAAAESGDGGAGVLLRLVPYGDDEDEDDDAGPEPPAAKAPDSSRQQQQQGSDADSAGKDGRQLQQQSPQPSEAQASQQQSSQRQQHQSLPPDKQQLGNGSPARQAQQRPSQQQEASPQPNLNSAAAASDIASKGPGPAAAGVTAAAAAAPPAAAAGQQLLSPDVGAHASAAATLTPTKRGSGDLSAAAAAAAAAGWEGDGSTNSQAAKRLKSAAAGAAAAGSPQQQQQPAAAAAADTSGMDVPA